VIENGHLAQKTLALAGGCADLLVTSNPVYLRGIGKSFTESPSGILRVPAFNLAGQPIAATAVFVNDSQEGVLLQATFQPTAGFAIEPASVERQLAAGEQVEIPLALTPDGSVRRARA